MARNAASKSAFVNVRVAPDTKAEAEQIFAELGLSTSEAVNLFLRQVILRRGLPFEVRLPNAETLAALREDVSELPGYDDAARLLDDALNEAE